MTTMTTINEPIVDLVTGTIRHPAWQPAKHFHCGDNYADMLDCLTPANAATAIATGRIELRGTHANRSEGKKGRAPAVYLWMQTFGEIPTGIYEPVQKSGNFIGLTSETSVNFILDHFGVCLDDIRDMVGVPTDYESKNVELYDVILNLCPVFKSPTFQVTF